MERKKRLLTKNLDPRKRRLHHIRVAATTVLVILLLLIAGCFGIGEYLVLFAVGPSEIMGNVNLDPGNTGGDGEKTVVDENREKFKELKEDWLSGMTIEDVSIQSDDGLNLKGFYYPAKEESHDYALLLHGYRDTHKGMENFAYVYNTYMNFNCLLPDMRACGESEGKYVGMGYLDSKDVADWVDYIVTQDAQARILISGVSMGGATTMMVSGLELPDNVVCFIEDCGYTSVWDIFEHELDFLFHLPAFPLLYVASAISSLQVGYSFTEASSLDALSRCEKPMLFIHGKEDDFVSYSMLDKVYAAKTKGVKEELSVDGAGHASSYLQDPELYFTTVHDFLEENFFVD